MTKPKILVQLDCDSQASVFDGVVAVDSGVDHLFRHSGVTPDRVRELVYGAMFTRGGEDLASTAIFIGGSDVNAGSRLLKEVVGTFFGPVRVSVMVDSNGANTTAAGAVLAAEDHLRLNEVTALVLGATGPVGRRVVSLLAGRHARVHVGSRSRDRAEEVCSEVARRFDNAQLTPFEIGAPESVSSALDGAQLVIAAGAPGVELLSAEARGAAASLQVAIDLNAVPPLGVAGIEVTDRAKQREGHLCYGAVGVGSTKMKIHKAAVRRLFESNELVLDTDEIYQIGRSLRDG